MKRYMLGLEVENWVLINVIELLSLQYMSIGSVTIKPRSFMKIHSHMISLATLDSTQYFASMLDNDIVSCFLEICEHCE